MAGVASVVADVLRVRFGAVGDCLPARQPARISELSSAARIKRDQACWSAPVEAKRRRMMS